MTVTKSQNDSVIQKPSIRVYIATTSALMGALAMGAVLAWSAAAFYDMDKNDSKIIDKHDKNTKSWVGSCITLGALFGALLSGPLSLYLGKKKCLIIYGVPFTIGWVLLGVAKSVPLIIVGRAITGLSAGFITGTAPSYITEISTPNIRGLLGAGFQVFVVTGIFIINIFGLFLHWNTLCIVALIPGVLMSILMIFMPESPVWLYSRGRKDEAEDALRKLRHHMSNIDSEMKGIEEQITNAEAAAASIGEMIQRPEVYKPLLLAIGLMFFQQFSGINAILFYATDIFKESGSSMNPMVGAVLVSVAQIVGTVMGSLLVDRLGRRILLLASGLGHSITLCIVGYYYFKHKELEDETTTTTMATTIFTTITSSVTANSTIPSQHVAAPSDGWIPVACLIVFNIFFSIGYGPIPWMMVPEMTAIGSRSFISTVGTIINWLLAFVTTKEFSDIEKFSTKHGAFWIFTGCCVLSLVFVIFFLPETKGKSIEEIQSNFMGVKYNETNNNNNKKKNDVSIL